MPQSIFDLSVPYTATAFNRNRVSNILKTLSDFGYTDIALDRQVKAPLKTVDVATSNRNVISASTEHPSIKVYHRITIKVENVTDAYTIVPSLDILKGYDIVAVIAETLEVFEILVKSKAVDIVALEMGGGVTLPFPIRQAQIDRLCENNVALELQTIPFLRSSSTRSTVVSTLSSISRGIRASSLARCLILSGGATEEMEVRTSFDSSALFQSAGLSPAVCAVAWTENPLKVIQSAIRRRMLQVPGVRIETNMSQGTENFSTLIKRVYSSAGDKSSST